MDHTGHWRQEGGREGGRDEEEAEEERGGNELDRGREGRRRGE